MSDQSQGPGWWQASDGRWYPPSEGTAPPEPGWWLASDGRWYPPADEPPAPGWWLASDGQWYPPADDVPSSATSSAPAAEPVVAAAPATVAPVAAPAPPDGSSVALRGLPATLEAPAPGGVAVAERPATAARRAGAGTAGGGRSGSSRGKEAGRGTTSPRRRDLGGPGGPQDQIARRDEASRQDAKVLAAARARAAKGALATLRAQIEAEQASPSATARSVPDAPAKAPTPGGDTAAGRSSDEAGGRPAADGPAGEDAGATLDRSPKALPGAGQPLLEVRPSAVATDLDRLGDRLAVYDDRVSMLDRHDNVRERIDGHEIADVVLSKRFTGWVVTVEAGSGETITVKGLRHEQAEEIRDLIMRRTRRTGPAPSRPARPTPSADATAEAGEVTDITDGATPVDRVRLLAALDALHEARVLTDDEVAAKRKVVEELTTVDPITSTT